jgi:uncharacterized tellurite resistance protein B-like protein
LAKANSSKEVIDKFKSGKSVDDALKKFLPIAVAFICCVDGDVDNKEKERVGTLGKKFLGSQFVKKDFMEAIEDLSILLRGLNSDAKAKFEDGIIGTFSRSKFSSNGEKKALVAMLCEIALADGSLHENEVRFIDRVSEAINFENPFQLKIDDQKKPSIPDTDPLSEGVNAFAFVGKMLADSIIQSGIVPKSKQSECYLAATRVVVQNMELSMALLGEKENARLQACVDLTRLIQNELGLKQGNEEGGSNFRSNVIYASNDEEFRDLQKKANIYASIGLLSLFGFIGCFGYAIYLFFTATGNPLTATVAGVILFFVQKVVGKKHDEIVK